MALILEASLTESPSELSAFRSVTLMLDIWSGAEILLECPEFARDSYYRYLKKMGAYDYIREIVSVEEAESGVRVYQNSCPHPVSLIIPKITLNNQMVVIGRIGQCLKSK